MRRARVPSYDGFAALLGAGVLVAGCAGGPKPAAPTAAAPPPPLDASYDWRVLVPAPFGSKLKDVPFTLHEVLVFRDSAAPGPADDADCYSRDEPPPRFVGHTPDQYMLCFRHDRLARIEAAVLLERDRAAQTFADACGAWQRGPAAVPPSAAPPAVPAGTAGGESAGADPHVCSGQTGTVAYNAHLDDDATADDVPLSIRLDGAPDQT